jgi:hypothetical protein
MVLTIRKIPEFVWKVFFHHILGRCIMKFVVFYLSESSYRRAFINAREHFPGVEMMTPRHKPLIMFLPPHFSPAAVSGRMELT